VLRVNTRYNVEYPGHIGIGKWLTNHFDAVVIVYKQ
jgi:hypothetical protein